jgi:nucleotide-binding universal stress UspA family protein
VSLDAPILICYDGSDGAREALEAATAAFTRPALVVCYWQPFAESTKRMSINLLEMVQDPDGINDREQALARAIAEEGAALVHAADGVAEAMAVRVSDPIDQAIMRHADEIDAFAIVLGSRSRSGFGSMLLGDTAGDVVQLANRPVFVVPSTNLAEQRKANRTRGSSAAV